jgi:hypothetical protein
MTQKDKIISEHLPYEIDMLRHAYERLQSSSHGQATLNVLIECFSLHARNLLDFFWDPKHSNYAVAREFTTALYQPFSGTSPKKDGLYGKLNEQVTHLTYGRTEDPADKIGPAERLTLKNLIESEIDNFSNHIQEQFRELWRRRAEALIITSQATQVSGTTSSALTVTVGMGATGPIGP